MNKSIKSPSHHGKREGSRRQMHSQIERRRREKINDRLVLLRNTVPACALLMARRLGHYQPIKGPLAHRYTDPPLTNALSSNPALQAALLAPAPQQPQAPQSNAASTYYEEELGLNKLDVLVHTVDYIFELHGYIEELLQTQRCMEQKLKLDRTSDPPRDHDRALCAPPAQELNSLRQYSVLSASKQPHLVRSSFVDSCTASYSGPPPELVPGNRTSRNSAVSDGAPSVDPRSPSPPALRPRDRSTKELHQLPSPSNLPILLSSPDVVPIHLPFPSVLTGKPPGTLPSQPPPDHSPKWSGKRPRSPPFCGAPRFRATSTEMVPPKPDEEDARLLIDLRTASFPSSLEQPKTACFTRTPLYDDEDLQGEKKRRRLTTMAVDSLVAAPVEHHSH